MLKLHKTIVPAFILLAVGCGREEWPETNDVRISWDRSTFTEMTSVNVAGEGFAEENLYYPRIKRLSDGTLLMSFENDHFGWDVYVRRSEDGGKTWSDASLLVKTSPAVSTVGEDEKVYVNPDFIELNDGRVLLAYQWRYKKGYNDLPNTNQNCGIEVMFSGDSGRTFSEPVEVYRGRCWEPAMLQLPSGEIQMYITSSQELIDNMSAPQTVVIRSFDGGKTWQGKERCGIDDNEVIARTVDSRSTYDGMPSGVWLDDNNGIAVPIEVWHGKWVVDQTPVVVKTDVETNWHRDLEAIRKTGGPEWPMKKQLNKDFYGYGPYSTKLGTGEMVVLSNGQYKGQQGIWTFIGDRKADNFTNATTPFDGYWGSVDYIGDNKIFATGTVKYQAEGKTRGMVRAIVGRLNYSKTLVKGDVEPVPVEKFDQDSNDCWFLGHISDSRIFTDFGWTDENLVLISYLYDRKLTALTTENSDAVELLLARLGGPQYKIVVNGAGAYVVYVEDNFSWRKVSEGAADSVEVVGTLNDDSDEDLGFSAKLSVPWNILGGKPSAGEVLKAHLRHHYKAKTSEKPAWQIEDVEGENSDYPAEWLSLRLK